MQLLLRFSCHLIFALAVCIAALSLDVHSNGIARAASTLPCNEAAGGCSECWDGLKPLGTCTPPPQAVTPSQAPTQPTSSPPRTNITSSQTRPTQSSAPRINNNAANVQRNLNNVAKVQGAIGFASGILGILQAHQQQVDQQNAAAQQAAQEQQKARDELIKNFEEKLAKDEAPNRQQTSDLQDFLSNNRSNLGANQSGAGDPPVGNSASLSGGSPSDPGKMMDNVLSKMPDQQSNAYIPDPPISNSVPKITEADFYPDSSNVLFPPGTDTGLVSNDIDRQLTIPATGQTFNIPKGSALWANPTTQQIEVKPFDAAQQITGEKLSYGANPQLKLLDPNGECKGGNYGFISPNCLNIRSQLEQAHQKVGP